MKIIVNSRNFEITETIRNYAEEKIGKFEKYLQDNADAIVTLTVEKYRHKAEVLFKIKGVLIQAESITGDIYASIDEVVEKLEKQVVKYKEKLQDFRKSNKRNATEIFEEENISRGKIIKHKKFDIKPMHPDDAANQMELLNKDFFIFTNQSTGDINIIYRRKDSNYGLIEPSR